ncbi:NAD dependent epimerase/dehydratase [Colletotrichum higginsianum]|uniref:NAD dependent epimerase/dehydratase n=2 Tax=Colletotrichum higginsianum TaxID=80884 RepID=H1VAX1_COLHI|nr:NAD dependent epimerase/dehydratase [Colletotrichum higginsianum IMI 349063]OBR03224.1 NAD dependent epimerase/dehydratase [Colletotrichum higginsianum IMI 349063]TIC89925.1 Aldehyde reductase 2 [Colletotrichum higginsianum]CCF37374.1 NAD dependent epimerase/dehydratase [Colletotrichum higginsianum]
MSDLTALPKGSLILVTGANGYIGSHTINTLLQLGYRIRGTVRSEKPWLTELFKNKYGEGVYEQVVVPRLDDPEALGQVMTGVDGVIHVASDVSMTDDPNAAIPWVVKATESALAAAAKHSSVKRVVLTSSAFAAVVPIPDKKGVHVDETTFNEDAIKAAWDPNTPKEIKPGYVYAASKAEGERAAWKWVEEHKPGYTFNTVLPNFNTGEILHPEIRGSTMGFARDVLKGQGDMLLAFMPQWYVDVVDVARLHAVALLADPVKSQRIWASAAPVNTSDFIDLFRELRPDNKLIPEKPASEGRDLTELPPAAKAEGLLQKYFGQKGWTPFRESVEAGIRDS